MKAIFVAVIGCVQALVTYAAQVPAVPLTVSYFTF